MVEIYKVIAYTIYYVPLIRQIFDDKNKNVSVKGANNNRAHNIFSRIDICDIPLRSDFLSDNNNPNLYNIICNNLYNI